MSLFGAAQSLRRKLRILKVASNLKPYKKDNVYNPEDGYHK
jgi:hypothetical protein